jgi:streptogramin lyase
MSIHETLGVAGTTRFCSRFLSGLFNQNRRRRQGKVSAPGRQRFARLELDALEDRIVPATSLVSEFGVTAGSQPSGITSGSDGNLWFTEFAGNRIGVINPTTHAISEFTIPTAGSGPQGITAGPGGNLWFTEFNASRIGTINPTTHAIVDFPTLTPGSGPHAIALGADGNLWFTEMNANKIGMINPTTHVVMEFSVAAAGGITAGPDGNLWFTEGTNIGVINPMTHVVVNIPIAFSASNITTGSDGNLWFIDGLCCQLGDVNPTTHVANRFGISEPNSFADAITTGPDGNLWIAEFITVELSSNLLVVSPHDPSNFNEIAASHTSIASITAGPDRNLWFADSGDKIGVAALPAAVVASTYRVVLNRVPAASELTAWLQFLDAGGTLSGMAKVFWESPEHRGIQVDNIYQTFLHRTESAMERAAWVFAFESGMSEIQIDNIFLASPEYQALHPTDPSFVDALYHDVLGRQDTGSEQSGWVMALESGESRSQVALTFLTSPEHYMRIVDQYYRTILGRPPDTTGEANWTNALLRGFVTTDQVAEAFLASDEFFAKAMG